MLQFFRQLDLLQRPLSSVRSCSTPATVCQTIYRQRRVCGASNLNCWPCHSTSVIDAVSEFWHHKLTHLKQLISVSYESKVWQMQHFDLPTGAGWTGWSAPLPLPSLSRGLDDFQLFAVVGSHYPCHMIVMLIWNIRKLLLPIKNANIYICYFRRQSFEPDIYAIYIG
jgi:hypothetical protein